MQSGVLNLGAVDARNLNPDPRCVNVANYRATGLLSSGSDAGVPHIQVRENEPVTSTYVDPATNFTVASVGYVPGDLLTVEAEVRGTVSLDMSGQLTGYSGTVLEYVDNPTVTVTGAGWVKVRATARVVSVSGGYVRAIIRVNTSTTPVGEGFDVRRYLVVRNGEDVAYFDGSTVSPSFTYEWTGAPDSSESVRRILMDTDSVAWVSRVLVGGVEREVMSWSTDREISGGLPSALNSSGSGVTQATGSISFAGDDVQHRPRSPFSESNGWVPARGDSVSIFVSDGTTEWQQFHGLIDKVSGDIAAGFQATLIDHYDKLSTAARHQPLLRGMPPQDGGGAPFRYPSLTALYYIDHFLRAAGFNATPPTEKNSIVTVHGQSSVWPVVGVLLSTTTPNPAVTEHPTINRAPWGIAMSGFTATYRPGRFFGTSDPLQITMCVAPDHAGTGYVRARCANTSQYAQLMVNVNRRAIVYVDGAAIVGIDLTSDESVVSALFKGNEITILTDTGRTVTGSAVRSGGTYESVLIQAADGARVAGMQVSAPTFAGWELVSPPFKATAHFDTAQLSLMSIMDAAPSIKDRTVADVLSEICEAKLSSIWIDETGVMQWADAETLETKLAARGVTTLDDIVSLSWESALLQSASKVSITGRRPGISVGRWKNRDLPVANTTRDALKSGDTVELFLEPPSDTTWIQPNLIYSVVGASATSWTPINDIQNTVVGMYCTSDGGETELYGAGYERTITFDILDYEKFLIKITAGNWAANVEGVVATPPNNTNVQPRFRQVDLPRLTGGARVEWSDRSYEITDLGGNGPELVHETGVWCSRQQDETILVRYAEFLRDHVVAPKPIVNGMEIVPDPRLQLGDVIYVRSDALLGARFRALIVSKSTSFGDDGLSMTLGIRVLTVDPGDVTYEGWQQALPASVSTYADFNNLAPTPQTYAEFNEG